jgi:membrane protease YdiL (CAAX protease family)
MTAPWDGRDLDTEVALHIPRHAATRRRPALRTTLLAAVAVIVLAEAVVALRPVTGAVLHGLVFLVLLMRWVSHGRLSSLVLALVPFARVTSLALTPVDDGLLARALTVLPLTVAVGWVYLAMPGRWPHLRTPLTPPTVTVALVGLPVGLVVADVLDLAAMPDRGAGWTVLTVPVVFLSAGAVEEMLFRGLVQPSLEAQLGSWSVVVTAVLSAATYLPTRDPGVVVVMAVVSLALGWYVRRTGWLSPAVVAHGLLATGALVLWSVMA